MAVDTWLIFGVFLAALAFFHLSEFALAFLFNRSEVGFQCEDSFYPRGAPGRQAAGVLSGGAVDKMARLRPNWRR